jgi:hypothetical protein
MLKVLLALSLVHRRSSRLTFDKVDRTTEATMSAGCHTAGSRKKPYAAGARMATCVHEW